MVASFYKNRTSHFICLILRVPITATYNNLQELGSTILLLGLENSHLKNFRDFSGGPVVRTPFF